ncbi:hypothetical protein ABC795_11225 [Blastococcus sp. HT6-30]|uniref:hypothetical protein n=1 Tax=Blastococcus sp. HT6-30 TaxID=3144843 RepID=UPI00321B806F
MTEPTPSSCPECGGANIPNHPAGPIVFKHDTLAGCSLQAAEDARVVADQSLEGDRPTTPTERLLLAAVGLTIADDATCLVEWLSPGVRRRTWLARPADETAVA